MNPLSHYLGSQIPQQTSFYSERLETSPHRGRSLLLALAATVVALAALALPGGAFAAGPADHLAVTVSPRPATVGQTITITAKVKDANNATVTDYAAYATVKDSAGALKADDPGKFINGVSTTTATVTAPVHGEVIYVEDNSLISGQSAAFNVQGPVDHLSLSMKSSVDAYAPFDVTARALDAAGNTVTGYSSPASWSDTNGVLSPSSPAGFVAGVSKTSASVSSPTSGADTITLTSGGLSVQRKFTAFGRAVQLDVRVPGSAKVGAAFPMTVTARDEAGNVVKNYDGSMDYYTGTDSYPPLAPYQNGVSKSTLTWSQPAHQLQIGVSGAANGVSNPINILGPASVPTQTFERTDHSTSCASIKGILTLKMVDAAGNLLSDYNADFWQGQEGFLHDTPVLPGTPAAFVRGVSKTKLSIVNSDGRTQDWLLVLDGSSDFMQIC